jgi:protein-tyrosine phosphatase
MWRILHNLYLGDVQDARNRFVLEQYGITHILNCAAEIRCFFRGDFRYLHLKLNDPDPAFSDNIPKICRFIRAGRRRGAVLVHCRMGCSRSPAAILAYLCRQGRPLEEALRILQKGVSDESGFIEPHPVFLEQLEDYLDEMPGEE